MKFKPLFIIAALLVLAGCSKEYGPFQKQEAREFEFKLEAELDVLDGGDIEGAEPETKASATTVVRLKWAKGDEISVINLTTGKALGGSLVADKEGTITTFSGTLSGTVRNGDKMIFLYPSQGYTQEQDYEPVTIDLSQQKGNSKENVPICVYATANASGNTFSSASATFKFLMSYLQLSFANLEKSDLIKEVKVENIGNAMTLSLSSDDLVATPSVGTITLTPPSYTTTSTGTKTFYISFAESSQVSGRKIRVKTENSHKEGNFSGAALAANTSYTSTVADFEDVSDSIYEYVDLGLPSGVKWATMNVGATKPEEYGDYFAWGETEPYYEAGYAQEDPQKHWKDSEVYGYDDDFNKYYGNSPIHHWTKYTYWCSYMDFYTNVEFFIDNKTVLDPEDDAAHVNWGGDWRMPTAAEQDELLDTDNCSWTWTTMNGINGYKVQSKKPGYTDKWIFLPAAGYRKSDSLGDLGSFGAYWSGSLNTDVDDDGIACMFTFSSSEVYRGDFYRGFGRSVRPVCP